MRKYEVVFIIRPMEEEATNAVQSAESEISSLSSELENVRS